MVKTLIIEDMPSLFVIAQYLDPHSHGSTILCAPYGCTSSHHELNHLYDPHRRTKQQFRVFTNVINIAFEADLVETLYWGEYDHYKAQQMLVTLGHFLKPTHLCVACLRSGPYVPYKHDLGSELPLIMLPCLIQWDLASITSHGFFFYNPRAFRSVTKSIRAYMPGHIHPCSWASGAGWGGDRGCQEGCEDWIMGEAILRIYDVRKGYFDPALKGCRVTLIPSRIRYRDTIKDTHRYVMNAMPHLGTDGGEGVWDDLRYLDWANDKFQITSQQIDERCVCCCDR
ncbi:uncharacterized protein I303_102307 [Kwoniella dejecticola CBS 10117]|uniref:Uncharacterized protein n=1 Tax=Kwoniella dejecticola CBS 10117 TaxID=1296121 RepID=A0A1A6ABB6_9TREE|nr:uncharacterized protein I303_01553 [Kwoniella dejecticola CBS 10117]OBR87351.1 hypothetical protein I303_01553 [Kwoniella dejecticola CBS 10117]